MIKKELKISEIDKLTEKIFLHFKEKENRSYPLLLTTKQIKKELLKLYEDSNSNYILDRDNGEIIGFCGYYIIEKEKYLQTTIFVSFNHNDEFIIKVLNYFKTKYTDYIKMIGLEAENIFISSKLKKFGFELVDDLYSTTLELKGYIRKENSNVEKINLLQWEDYKEIHERNFGKGYWNFKRIKEDFNNWIIYSIKEKDMIKAYVFIRFSYNGFDCEIFGMYGNDINYRIALIKHLIASIEGKKLLYYFIADYDEMMACKELGFKIHGHYHAWQIKTH